MFISFGANLPENTKAVLKYHYIGLVIPFMAFFGLIYIFKSNATKALRHTIYLFSLITFILTIIWHYYTVDVLYTPIFLMGEQ